MDQNSMAWLMNMPLGSGLHGLGEIPGMGGLGKVPGMGDVPGMQAQSPQEIARIPAPPTQPASPEAKPGMDPNNAAIGLDAMQLLMALGQPRQTPQAPAPGIAPRGNQVQTETPNNANAIDPMLRMSMANMLFGGR